MVTRTRNTISPVMALCEIVPPQVGPTSCSVIWFEGIPAALARAARSRSAFTGANTLTGGVVETADGVAVGVADAPAEAPAEALGVGVAEGVADAPGDGVADDAPDALTVGDTEGGVGVGVGVAPSVVRLAVRMLTWFPPMNSMVESWRPNRARMAWKSASVAPPGLANSSSEPPVT